MMGWMASPQPPGGRPPQQPLLLEMKVKPRGEQRAGGRAERRGDRVEGE